MGGERALERAGKGEPSTTESHTKTFLLAQVAPQPGAEGEEFPEEVSMRKCNYFLCDDFCPTCGLLQGFPFLRFCVVDVVVLSLLLLCLTILSRSRLFWKLFIF